MEQLMFLLNHPVNSWRRKKNLTAILTFLVLLKSVLCLPCDQAEGEGMVGDLSPTY